MKSNCAYFFILLLNIIIFILESHGKIEYTMRPKKIDCVDTLPKLCSDLMCDLKVISRQDIYVNLGCDIQRPIRLMAFKGMIYMKQGATYRKFGPDFTGELCDAVKNRKNIVLNSIFKQLDVRNSKIIHECPYYGPHFIKNLTVNEAFGLSVLPQGEYRIEVRLADGNTNQTVLHARMYFYVKAIDPLKELRNVFDMKFV